MEFPIKVIVYLTKGYQLKNRDARELASAIVIGAKSWVQHEFTSKLAEFTSETAKFTSKQQNSRVNRLNSRVKRQNSRVNGAKSPVQNEITSKWREFRLNVRNPEYSTSKIYIVRESLPCSALVGTTLS
ncbi:hypothetical protein [Peribacillus frigoritolerans]|uniref:hypothetical protein n=1 Tax=Peribacillus frigoritolerans TaxID=450367 RepID=UPI00207A6BD8|nr:hypothetical protein [Peribacillus frigoritolerans]USK76696.1 hypothetical protein LIT31_09205 [Peribacillus frigoritolerans]